MTRSDDDKGGSPPLPRPSNGSGLRSALRRFPKKPSPHLPAGDDEPTGGTAPHRPVAPVPAPPPSVMLESEGSPASAEPERMSLLGLDFVQDDELSVLVVGSEHPMLSAIVDALEQRGVHVEQSSVDAMLDAVVAATPSLVLLVGDAARSGGEAPLRQLRWRGFGASISTAVLMENTTTHHRLQALANGATAVIHQSASVDAIAREVAESARGSADKPERAKEIGSTTLSDLLDALGKRIVADLLPTDDTEATSFGEVRLTLGAEGEIAQLVERFSVDLREHVSDVERFEYALSSRAATAEILGDEALAEAASAGEISGLRVLLADSDPARADAVAQTLRDAGALVIVSGLAPEDERFEQLRQFDPAALLIGAQDLQRATRLVEGMEGDGRLRWASMLVVDWTEIYRPNAGAPNVSELFGRLAALGEQERSLRARAEAVAAFDTRIETVGPARTLRALTGASRPLRITVHHPRITVRVDLSEGLVVGATAQMRGKSQRSLEGTAALAAMLALRSGRVEVQTVGQAAAVNLMSTVDNALSGAESEAVPFRRSEFPSADLAVLSGRVAEGLATKPAEGASASGIQHALYRLTEAMSRTVVIGGRSVPLWIFASSAAVWLVLLIIVVAALVSDADEPVPQVVTDTPEQTAAEPTSPEAQETASAAAPATPALPSAAKAPPPTFIERVRQGDAEAIAELEARPPEERTVAETVALSEGKVAQARAELAELKKRLAGNAKLIANPKVQERLIALARDERTSASALELVAGVPEPLSADLIYEVWVGTTESTRATKLAQELAYTKPIRDKASPALQVALDLRATEQCGQFLPIIERAIADGDERSLHLLTRLAAGARCRPGRKCYRCLQNNQKLIDAITAVRDRPAPEL